jgi:hypothetical protein
MRADGQLLRSPVVELSSRRRSSIHRRRAWRGVRDRHAGLYPTGRPRRARCFHVHPERSPEDLETFGEVTGP